MPKKLAYSKGFGQRHWEVRGVTPFLKSLSLEYDLNLHRSAVTIDSIREDILKFDNTSNFTSTPEYRLAVSHTLRQFSTRSVPMLHLNDIFDYDLPIWSSSPGLPWRDMNYKTKKDVVKDPDNRKNIRWFWHRVKNRQKVFTSDCLAHVRSHLAEPGKEKVRAVWGYPLTMTLGEAMFAIPLIEEFKKGGTPMAYGYETSTGGFKRLIDESSKYKWYTAVDFKDFDKTAHKTLIEQAFDILEYNIDFSNYRDYGVADSRRNYTMWNFIKEYFINTPIRMANGERYQKDTGVASGSYFTQLIDSVVNAILMNWAFIRQFGRPPKFLRVLGDDSFIADDEPLDLDDFSELVETFGMKVNEKKSMVTKRLSSVKFLGFKINHGAPEKPFTEWLSALLLPERPDYKWDDVATRALGLLYANSGIDSDFDRICRAIICLREYDLILPRSMVRMLRVMGINYLSKSPPSSLEFAKRLKIL